MKFRSSVTTGLAGEACQVTGGRSAPRWAGRAPRGQGAAASAVHGRGARAPPELLALVSGVLLDPASWILAHAQLQRGSAGVGWGGWGEGQGGEEVGAPSGCSATVRGSPPACQLPGLSASPRGRPAPRVQGLPRAREGAVPSTPATPAYRPPPTTGVTRVA